MCAAAAAQPLTPASNPNPPGHTRRGDKPTGLPSGAGLTGDALIGLTGAVLTKDEEQRFTDSDRHLMLLHFR